MFDINNPNPFVKGAGNPYAEIVPFMGLPLYLKGQERYVSRSELAAANNLIYTVPNGKKLLVLGIMITNVSGGAITPQVYSRISGADYKIVPGSSTANNAQANLNPFYVLNAGEGLVVNPGGAANVYCHGVLFDAEVPLKTYSILSVDTTPRRLVYTPPGYRTFLIHKTSTSITPFFGGQIGIALINDSGGAVTITTNLWAKGEIASATKNQLSSISVANAGQIVLVSSLFMDEEEQLWFVSSSATAGQRAWVTVYEAKKTNPLVY